MTPSRQRMIESMRVHNLNADIIAFYVAAAAKFAQFSIGSPTCPAPRKLAAIKIGDWGQTNGLRHRFPPA